MDLILVIASLVTAALISPEILPNVLAAGEGKLNDTVFWFRPEDFDILPAAPKTESHSGGEKNPNITPNFKRPSSCDYNPEDEMLKVDSKIVRGNKRVSEIQCEYNMWEYKYRVLEYNRSMAQCSNESGDYTGIYQGREVSPGEFPHMGNVGWRKPRLANETSRDAYVFKCGCSLISPGFALTAAHCTSAKEDSETDFKKPEIIRFGSIDIRSDDTSDSIIKRIYKFEKYSFLYSKYNDIALFELFSVVSITQLIRPACLHTGDVSAISKLTATGWGLTEKGVKSNNLLYVDLEFTDRNECQSLYESTNNFKGLYDHQLCAGQKNGKGDTCTGDSGGPIQIQSNLPSNIDETGVMYHIVGVTSSGKGCGTGTYPGIYTKVSDPNFLCWIEQKVWPGPNEHCGTDTFKGYDI